VKESLKNILSVDLAVKSYDSFGFALLMKRRREWEAVFLTPRELGLCGEPTTEKTADALATFCERYGVNLLLIDGPQGWKKRNSPLPYRKADLEARAPAKVCEKGVVKPQTYFPFVEFSTRLFHILAKEYGMKIFGAGETAKAKIAVSKRVTLAESLPYSSWRVLGLKPLPAKPRCETEEIFRRFQEICDRFEVIRWNHLPSHDELQALVAGIAGVRLAEGRLENVVLLGAKPELAMDCIYEGYIVCVSPGTRSLDKNFIPRGEDASCESGMWTKRNIGGQRKGSKLL